MTSPDASNCLGVPVGWAGGTALNSVAEVRAEAKYAAAGGFDSFWVSQIFGVDPMVALAAVADDLGDLNEVGTSVVPIYGRHPMALAAMANTAQDATGGRFTLGIGPSHESVVEGLYGLSYAKPYSFTREYLDAIDPLLKGESVSVVGDQVTTHGWLHVESQPVPVLLAAMGTKMLELAGARTEGTSLGGAVGPKTIANHIVPTITAAAEKAGRPYPRIKSLVSVCVTDDPAAAIAHGIEQSQGYAKLPAYRAMLDREGLESPGELLIAGSPDQVIEGLAGIVAAGATELRIGASGPTADVLAATRNALPAMLRG